MCSFLQDGRPDGQNLSSFDLNVVLSIHGVVRLLIVVEISSVQRQRVCVVSVLPPDSECTGEVELVSPTYPTSCLTLTAPGSPHRRPRPGPGPSSRELVEPAWRSGTLPPPTALAYFL